MNFINSNIKLSYMMRTIFAHVDITLGPDENHFAHTLFLLSRNVGYNYLSLLNQSFKHAKHYLLN